jgi:hypothetical protein
VLDQQRDVAVHPHLAEVRGLGEHRFLDVCSLSSFPVLPGELIGDPVQLLAQGPVG